MTREGDELLHRRISGIIIRLFYRVYDRLGFGFLESVYARALAHEFTAAGIAFKREAPIDVWYDGVCVGQFRVDFLIEDRIVLELKASAGLVNADRAQLLNYLRCSRMELGFLLHFGPRAAYERLIHTNDRKRDLLREV